MSGNGHKAQIVRMNMFDGLIDLQVERALTFT
jgi:hypothetical protein